MSESAINIYCENTEQVVESKAASNHLGKILKSMGLSNRNEILKIYNRIKNKDESLTDKELETIEEMIYDSEFEVAYKEYIASLNIGKRHREKLSFGNIIVTIQEFINSIKVIQILKQDGIHYHNDGLRKYIVLKYLKNISKKRETGRNNQHIKFDKSNKKSQSIDELKKSRIIKNVECNYYYEIIDQNDYFEVLRNLKTGKYILIDKNKGEVIFDSDNIFYIGEKLIEGIYFLDGTRNEKVGIISEFGYERIDTEDCVIESLGFVYKISQINNKIIIKCINKEVKSRKDNSIILDGEKYEVQGDFLYFYQINEKGEYLIGKIELKSLNVTSESEKATHVA